MREYNFLKIHSKDGWRWTFLITDWNHTPIIKTKTIRHPLHVVYAKCSDFGSSLMWVYWTSVTCLVEVLCVKGAYNLRCLFPSIWYEVEVLLMTLASAGGFRATAHLLLCHDENNRRTFGELLFLHGMYSLLKNLFSIKGSSGWQACSASMLEKCQLSDISCITSAEEDSTP